MRPAIEQTPQFILVTKLRLPKHAECGQSLGVMHCHGSMSSMEPVVLALGFLQEFVTVMLMGALLALAGPSLPTYVSRVRFLTLAGIAVAVFTDLGAPIWWRHPWPFHLVSAVYTVTAWFVAGLVLSAVVGPRSGAAAFPVAASSPSTA